MVSQTDGVPNMATGLLDELARALAGGDIDIVDLTQTLSEDTPVLALPPEFGQTAHFSRMEISRYDERGAAWYWSDFTVGEHTAPTSMPRSIG